jgi:hypothetical protein
MAARGRLLGAVAGAVLMLSGCGSSGSGTQAARSFDEVLRSISQSQDVDVTIVRTAVAQEADTADDQMQIALRWDRALPQRPLPRLQSTWDDLSEYAAQQLKSATCDAIFDTLASGEVPDGQQFFNAYLANLATGRLPSATERAIMAEFDQLAAEADAGTLTATDVRFSLMKLRYC